MPLLPAARWGGVSARGGPSRKRPDAGAWSCGDLEDDRRRRRRRVLDDVADPDATRPEQQGHDRDDRDQGGNPASHPGDSDAVALDGAGHAVAATAPLAELEPGDLDDLHASLAHLRDRERVALVGDDHTGLQRDDVVAVVPLLTFLLVLVATGLDDLQLAEAQRVRHGRDEVLLGPHVDGPRTLAGPDADRPDPLRDLRVG